MVAYFTDKQQKSENKNSAICLQAQMLEQE